MSLIDALLLEPPPFEVWIALRSDGQKGSGSQADPFNGAVKLGGSISATLAKDSSDSTGKTAIATVTAHDLLEYDVVAISGTATAFDGTFQVFDVKTTEFKYKATSLLPASSASGTAKRVIYQFDDVMRAMPPWMTVRLGPGIFETRGSDLSRPLNDPAKPARAANQNWMIRRGQKIIGAGMGLTTVKLMFATGSAGAGAFGHTYFAGDANNIFLESFEASDFTVDCNLRQQLHDPVMKVAIIAGGKHIRLRHLRAIDFGTNVPGVECFPIGTAVGHSAVPQPVDCRIEDCVVEQPNGNGVYNSSCFMLFSGEEPAGDVMMFHRACAIRNCYGNCEYLDDPVSIATIGNITGTPPTGTPPITADVTTRSNHGRLTDDWIVISGALESGLPSTHFNGSFKITKLSDTQFRITAYTTSDTDIPTTPTGNMFVGRFSSHRVPVKRLDKDSALIARMTTHAPHNRKPGDMVNVWQTRPVALSGTENYYGRFAVLDPVINPFELRYQMLSEPTALSVTGETVYMGSSTFVLSGDGGSEAVIEGNRVFSTWTGGSYHDTFSTKDITNRNNYYSDVLSGPTQSLGGASKLKLGSSITFSGTTATFYTQNNHGLSAGQEVIIRGALMSQHPGGEPTYANPYNGKFTLPAGTNPNSTSFSYTMLSTPPPPLNSSGSPVFGDVKTGSSLIRKDQYPATAVFTAIRAHGLASGQTVTIKAARVGNAYPEDSTSFNGQKQVTVDSAKPTLLEYSLVSGSASDPDASGSPVFSTEQAATSLSANGTVATFQAANAVGLFVGQIVKITGATVTAFNGAFRVVSVTGSSFTYNLESSQSGSAGGTPAFTAFLTVTSIVRSDQFGNANANGLYAKVTTPDKHRLQFGDTVSVWAATVAGSYDNPYNGAFRVEKSITDFSFLYALEFNPGADASGSPMWASQNSTPLARLSDPTPYAVFTSDKPVAVGQKLFPESTLAVRSLVSVFGAVVNGSLKNSYSQVVKVYQSDHRSFRFRFFPSDPLQNASGGPACAIAVATPLAVTGTTATFRSELKHGFFSGQAVQIEDPLQEASAFRGFFNISSIPTELSFTFEYSPAPGGNAPPGYQFTARWQVVQIVNENNVLEQEQTRHPDTGYGPSQAIVTAGVNLQPQYTFRRVILRDNILRRLPGTSYPEALGIATYSAENLLVERNIVDLVNPNPLQGHTNKNVRYFNNQNPSGTTIRGLDSLATVKYDELTTQIDDALLLCL